MELNEVVAQIKDDHESYGQWLYFFSIFGAPGGDEPWGWQIDGHHLVISTVVFDGRIATTPTFMGSEPRSIGDRSWFDLEEEVGLLSCFAGRRARAKAQIYPSITKADMPDPDLQTRWMGAGRRQGQDNRSFRTRASPPPSCRTRNAGCSRRSPSYKGWIADATQRCHWPRSRRVSTTRGSRGTAASARATPSLPRAQPGSADPVRPSRRRGVRQHRSVSPSHPHACAHAERR